MTALAERLRREPFDGYIEAIPTYRSLLAFHDPAADRDACRAHALALARRSGNEVAGSSRRIEIPCVYDGEDLADVAAEIGATPEEVVRLHAGREYRVFVVGFTPGFPYMGMTDPRLDLPRRATPRVRVPAGSVAIVRGQTGVYPWVTPGGWRLLGRTDPARLFDPEAERPSLCLPGDSVRFRPVGTLPDPPRVGTDRPGTGSEEGAPAIRVERGGLQTTVQDLGRPGHRGVGVPVSGAADPRSLIGANHAVGNEGGAAGLECALSGPTLRFLEPRLAAIGGADPGAVLEKAPGGPGCSGRWRVPVGTSFLAPAGSVLAFGGPPDGLRSYLAVAGGVLVPEVLGSRSTYLTAGFGGFRGRALREGDELRVGRASPEAAENRYVPEARRERIRGALRLRLTLGPQADAFRPEAVAALPDLEWSVSNDSSRMGSRLEGPALAHRGAAEIISDANPTGAVQVPPSGLPIVMLADQATTGGYPKIGTVVGPDLGRLAQALPGTRVGFEVVSLDEARDIALADRARLASGE